MKVGPKSSLRPFLHRALIHVSKKMNEINILIYSM